jgi:hypothetical protein
MNIVRDALEAQGRTVLISVHDAIITKEKLGVELMSAIAQLMRDESNNHYCRMGVTQLKRYAAPSP